MKNDSKEVNNPWQLIYNIFTFIVGVLVIAFAITWLAVLPTMGIIHILENL